MNEREDEFLAQGGPMPVSGMAGDAYTPRNHLAGEPSPYLLQHAGNPIGWYAWGPEPFEVAQKLDRPIFLSIGYSSCHWCHVMERECFNDQEVAELMNDACIPVKVDREERPDLDALFMEICRIQNGNGGWPLNLFLTPDGRPFFATTWLPKRTTGQMPGLTDILPRVKWLWLMQKEDVLRAADSLMDTMKARLQFLAGGRVGAATTKGAMTDLRRMFDPKWGGFRGAPKFPSVPRLLFLLRQATSSLNTQAERDEAFGMVDLTLRRMWRGGIHDHLGGGFSRYAADEQWIVPHFEKLLSDQAMLLLAVSTAHEQRPDPFFRLMADDIIGCVARDFTDPSPCFKTAIGSDSWGGEGLYYLWTEDQVHALLPEGDAGLFCAAYAVMPSGNFGHELAGSHIGYNILYEASTVAELSQRYGLRSTEISERLANDRRILLEARALRDAPLCDDKVLMDWNGLMIGALARASAAFAQPEWRTLAERVAFFLQKALVDPKGHWRRRWRDGVAGIPALPGDYAALLWGVTELHRAAKAAEANEKQLNDWLRYGEGLARALKENFWDERQGGFFLSPADDPNIFLRYKAAYDEALPSANALAAIGLTYLGAELDERDYAVMARDTVSCFARASVLRPIDTLSLITASSLLRAVRTKAKEAPPAEPDEDAAPPGEAQEPAAVQDADTLPGEQRSTRHERVKRQDRHERRFSRTRRARSKDK